MIRDRPYFFCGIGGSGMLPLALILRARGVTVAGSDRALDQGRTAPKFDYLKRQAIALFPQDGSGVTDGRQIVIASAAVEDTVPDLVAARRAGARIVRRAELLAELFNAAPLGVGVAGTSGKSTTTAMIGWIFHALDRDPTIVNGAVMSNFADADAPFASALVGGGEAFVSEVDESDGSIALYRPAIAVVNNIALDHKTMDELRALFRDFAAKAQIAVLNLENAETAALIPAAKRAITYSLSNASADLLARNIVPAQDGIGFDIIARAADGNARKQCNAAAARVRVSLKVPGRHNVSNALAALSAAGAAGIALEDAARALEGFEGVRRRLETVGSAGGVTVIDDFAHNPDKIAATLSTLHDFPGRLLVMFQPHGFGPLAKMKNEFIAAFATHMAADDILLMPEPVYFGGTTTREVSSEDIAAGIRDMGRHAQALRDRAACGQKLLELARRGDRIVIMGARDDTLSEFARSLLQRLD